MNRKKTQPKKRSTRNSRRSKTAKQKRIDTSLRKLQELTEVAPGIWQEDALEYVNKLRDNDRF